MRTAQIPPNRNGQGENREKRTKTGNSGGMEALTEAIREIFPNLKQTEHRYRNSGLAVEEFHGYVLALKTP